MADVELRSVVNYEALRGIGEISLFREVEDKTYAGPCSPDVAFPPTPRASKYRPEACVAVPRTLTILE